MSGAKGDGAKKADAEALLKVCMYMRAATRRIARACSFLAQRAALPSKSLNANPRGEMH